MLGPAFTRNSVTGKLFRTGALKARSGLGLGQDHGLPRGSNFGSPRSRSRKKREDAKASPVPANQSMEALPQAEPGGAEFVKKTEALFEIDGIALIDAKGGQCRWPAKSVDGAAHVCGAPESLRGLLRNPCRHRLSEREPARLLRSGVPISKQAPLEARAGPPSERRHDKIHQVAFRRPCQGRLPETGGAPCLAVQPANGGCRNSSRISLTISSWSRLCLALC